jgi:undecaprenyl-phosphate 4-deoxy-4-formamido-L-arabinose transferase
MMFSVVIPVYNGSKSISHLVEQLEIEYASYPHEIILVNDGSTDNSQEVCSSLCQKYKNIVFINLRKNFGEFNAVICGLSYVSSPYGIIIDDDFQNPPSEIIKLLNKAKEGDYDVVYSYYDEKKHHWFRNLGSSLINYLATFLLKKPKDLYLSSFKLIKKEVIDEIIKFKGPSPFIDGIIFQITNHVSRQLVIHNPRSEGKSNYSYRKLVSLFLNILFGYSLLPLRLTFLAGFVSIIFSLIYMLLYAFNIIPEWGSPVVIFMCGVILSALALIGEYLGQNFMISTGKPQYVIKDVIKKN